MGRRYTAGGFEVIPEQAQQYETLKVRIKKTRILVRSTSSEALRTIQFLIPAGSESVRMVRKLYAKPEV